jgi:threonine aldolase
MDGARLFNAAVAQGVNADKIAQYSDSVQFCLSKGLCAPVGTLLVGRTDFIAKARRYRKMLGGGMRQAGILAAAGIVGLQSMVDRLSEDHINARLLAESLATAGFSVDLSTVQTNIVIIDVSRMGMKADDFGQCVW